MQRHTPWTAQIEAVLSSLGVPTPELAHIKARHAALCQRGPKSPRLIATPRCQQVLFLLGVGPATVMEIVEYLDELTERRFPPEAVDERKAEAAARKKTARDKNRDAYNEYQRLYMRKRRAEQRAVKDIAAARTARARAAKTAPNTAVSGD